MNPDLQVDWVCSGRLGLGGAGQRAFQGGGGGPVTTFTGRIAALHPVTGSGSAYRRGPIEAWLTPGCSSAGVRPRRRALHARGRAVSRVGRRRVRRSSRTIRVDQSGRASAPAFRSGAGPGQAACRCAIRPAISASTVRRSGGARADGRTPSGSSARGFPGGSAVEVVLHFDFGRPHRRSGRIAASERRACGRVLCNRATGRSPVGDPTARWGGRDADRRCGGARSGARDAVRRRGEHDVSRAAGQRAAREAGGTVRRARRPGSYRGDGGEKGRPDPASIRMAGRFVVYQGAVMRPRSRSDGTANRGAYSRACGEARRRAGAPSGKPNVDPDRQ